METRFHSTPAFEQLLEDEVARHPSVFEARFRRRLTEGNETCPYWATRGRARARMTVDLRARIRRPVGP